MFVTLAGICHRRHARRGLLFRDAAGDVADRGRPTNSDDIKVVQALTQAFAQKHSQIRLRPVPTEGAAASAQALADGKADLAVIRGDLGVPGNAQAVATLRKNVVVLWVPATGKAKGRKAGPKITKIPQLAGHRIGVVGRTQANVNLLKVILQQYGVDPGQGRDRSVSGQRGCGGHPQPKCGRLSRRRPGQQQDHHRGDCGIDARRRCADLPCDRFGRGNRAEPSQLRSVRHPRRRLRRLARPARRRGQDHQLRAPYRRAQGACGFDGCRLHPAIVCDPAVGDGGIPAGRQDRDPRHRQGCRDSRCIPAPRPLSTVRKKPSSTATAITSGGP